MENNLNWRKELWDQSFPYSKASYLEEVYRPLTDDEFKKYCETYEKDVDFDKPLCDKGIKFLKEKFNIDDIDTLSDEEHDELLMKVSDFISQEVCKADDADIPISECGAVASDILDYANLHWRKGGKRWEYKPPLFNESIATVMELTDEERRFIKEVCHDIDDIDIDDINIISDKKYNELYELFMKFDIDAKCIYDGDDANGRYVNEFGIFASRVATYMGNHQYKEGGKRYKHTE